MEVVERKEAKRRAKMTPAKIELQNVKKKPKGSRKLTVGRCVTEGRWCVGLKVDVVNVQ